MRDIPNDVLQSAVDTVKQKIPASFDDLSEADQLIAKQRFVMPRLIMRLSEAGYFMSEIAPKLGFNTEESAEAFAAYKRIVREMAKDDIAEDILFGLGIDRTTEAASAVPDQPKQPVGERMFQAAKKRLFGRAGNTDIRFAVSELSKGKGAANRNVYVELDLAESIPEWETHCQTAKTRLSKLMASTASSSSSPTMGGKVEPIAYVKSIIDELI